MMPRPYEVLAEARRIQRNRVTPIKLEESKEWVLRGGKVSHVTGRFFRLVGRQWSRPEGPRVSRIFIDQPEVGLLGFVFCQDDDPWILLDAKFEPGNTCFIDWAPTVQATKSNQDQAHLGARPRLLELFEDQGIQYSGVLQSEQGTRFLNKWNRNVAFEVSSIFAPPEGMTWFRASQVKALLLQDHSLNTDARSVLVSSDWYKFGFAGRTSPTGKFSEMVYESASEKVKTGIKSAVSKILEQHGLRFPSQIRELDLSLIDGELTTGSRPNLPEVSATQVMVNASHRERFSWDQPLLTAATAGEEILAGALRAGTLRFLFRPVREVGFAGGAQLGNSAFSVDAARTVHPMNLPSPTQVRGWGKRIARIRQSDEGGRFYQQVVSYEILLLDQEKDTQWSVWDDAPSGNSVWLSVAEIKELIRFPGFFTNEARTSVSMLLGFI